MIDRLLITADDAEQRHGIVFGNDFSPELPALLAFDVECEFLIVHTGHARGVITAMMCSAAQDNGIGSTLPLAAHIRIAARVLGHGDACRHEQPSHCHYQSPPLHSALPAPS